jgi:glycosyltransferase involved in cell wall biosynthesis
MKVCAIIPALNEEGSIGLVLRDLPRPLVAEVFVVDNGSRDATAARAAEAGATVLLEPRRGYGSACLAGIARLPPDCDVVLFLDADHSDHAEEAADLLEPIRDGRAELVIGSRVLGGRLGKVEPGALLPQARFGNRLACFLMRILFQARFTDLGPFRAITKAALDRIAMEDTNFGWTVEMQVKALQHGLKVAEVPVSYRRRKGVSKITGTVSGTVRAGAKILWTIFRYAWRRPRSRAVKDAAPAATTSGAKG